MGSQRDKEARTIHKVPGRGRGVVMFLLRMSCLEPCRVCPAPGHRTPLALPTVRSETDYPLACWDLLVYCVYCSKLVRSNQAHRTVFHSLLPSHPSTSHKEKKRAEILSSELPVCTAHFLILKIAHTSTIFQYFKKPSHRQHKNMKKIAVC